MTAVNQMGQTMSAGSPYCYGSPGGGTTGPQGVNVGSGGPNVGIVAPQPRGVGAANMAALQVPRFGGATTGAIGKHIILCF